MYQNPYILKLRSILRKIGVTQLISRMFASNKYEKKFDNAIFRELLEEDTIYDIGANRGLYTKRFLEVARKGKVFAFEPVPTSIDKISELQKIHNNLILYPIALGSDPGEFQMKVGSDELNATSSLLAVNDKGDITVQLKTVDEIVIESRSVPNFLKIDVEGYEYEVLKGMQKTLKDNRVRVVAIEIHFTLLEQIGQRNAPSHISSLLKENHFVVNWVDPSHIVAVRKTN